ncbi:DUF5105 domain-containing protein [Streptococcus dentiloxodontae]
MKKAFYLGAIALGATIVLAACAKPELEASLSVGNISYLSGTDLDLKDNQTLIQVDFTLENTAKKDATIATSAKQFYLEDSEGNKVKAQKVDVDDLPDTMSSVDPASDSSAFDELLAGDSENVTYFFKVNNKEDYKVVFESKDEKTKGQTVEAKLKNFDGDTINSVKSAVDSYFSAVLLGGESGDYDTYVANDLNTAKSEFSSYFSDSLSYGFGGESSYLMPTGDEIPKVLSWIQTANRERGSYTVDNIIVAEDTANFNLDMKTVSLTEADKSYSSSHDLQSEVQNYASSHGGVTSDNVQSVAKQYYMETYLPNSIKEVTPTKPTSTGTDVFDGYSFELTKEDDKWAFPTKDSYSGNWEYYPLFYAYTGQLGTLTYGY